MKSYDSDICVICGKKPKTGRDHIPPRSIFPKPWPNDFITVPACETCNNKQSGLDEKFKVSIGLIAGKGIEGEYLFRDQTIKTLQHNRKLSRNMAKTTKDIEIITSAGLFIGKAPAVKLDSKSYDTVIDKIIRGLHFYRSGYILGDRVDVNINWYYSLSKDIFDMTSNWLTGIVGDGQFIYKYFYSNEEPFASVWVLQFFNKAWSSGTVIPKQENV